MMRKYERMSHTKMNKDQLKEKIEFSVGPRGY